MESPDRIDHDQLFKRLIEGFFEPTMRLLLPEAARRIRFDTVEFLPQEFFSDHPEGDKRLMDVVARVETTDGDPELILILGEIEYDRREKFLAEMLDRYTILRLRHKLPVFPFALYLTSGARGRTVEEYHENVLGMDVLCFRFACVALPSLDGIEYRQRDNPVAPALAALMRHRGSSRVEHKAHCLLGVAHAGLTDAELAVLLNVIETYLPVSPREEVEFAKMIQAEPFQDAQTLINPYERRGIQIGEQRGIQIGEQRGATLSARELLLLVLRRRFGELPPDLTPRVEQADADWCREMISRAVVAESLSEIGFDRSE